MSRAYFSVSSSTVSCGTTSSAVWPINSRESIMVLAVLYSRGYFRGGAGLARVVLDNDVLVEQVRFAVSDRRGSSHASREVRDIERKPGRWVLGFHRLLDDLVVLAADTARREGDGIALLQVGRGDIQLAAVHGDEAVADDLASLIAGIG